jgi:hypothetical protein
MIVGKRVAILATTIIAMVWGDGNLWAQAPTSSVLHIQQSVTTSKIGFPQYIDMYKVLDGARSQAEMLSLNGTLLLENQTANFSEVLWLLAYWQDRCPANDQSLTGANFIWTDIVKNPSQSTSQVQVNLTFPDPVPMTGCVGLVFAGGPVSEQGATVTMSADLNLTYQASSSNQNGVVGLAGEYCFGQDWGCQNATTDDDMGFGFPNVMPAGHLVELFGDISDSTFDGTSNFGPLPTGNAWGAVNEFYLLPGGCGQFADNLNSQGFPNPQPLSTLHSWLPKDALPLESVPMKYEIPEGSTGEASLQQPVQKIFAKPLLVNSGDCVVVIYGRTGNGATDDETQVNAVMAP